MQFLPMVSTPQQFGRTIAEERAKLGTIIERAKLAE
jgi:hypothetical protein